ncbi:MAG: N-acetylmuramoyl-L-alanine amidase [Oscillospiraceae bacterium]|nr:N-acetylmuramoyl-L-alanine amidase [Oscillospiraceae bacterium]
MEQSRKSMQKQRKRPANRHQTLVGLIYALVAVLMIVVCIALVIQTRKDEEQDTSNSTESNSSQGLVITSPAQLSTTTVENTVVFEGTSDPGVALTINGSAVDRAADGSFRCEVALSRGTNSFVLSHKGETVTYQVEYWYAVQSFFPAADASYNCGATMKISTVVREGSTLQVMLGSKQIAMKKSDNQIGSGLAEGFVLYTGAYQMPTGLTSDQTIGTITYTVTCDGVTETYTSGTITCLKAAEVKASDPSVTPDYGEYIDVGSGYIVEIIADYAETFDGATTDDYSFPSRNYLPAGTVDYGSQNPLNYNKLSYMLMRCGRRVYVQKNNYPAGNKTKVVDCYPGTLPDHNEVGFASLTVSGHHTILTLDTLWKAPFYFDMKPQNYVDPGNRNYQVTSLTAQYIDITFCYATSFTGTVKIPADNPLFSSAELTRNQSDCTLRLYLKKTGGFYGWDAYYNENDQLCFRFLNPVPVSSANNSCGADLTGVRIMIDVGHGGVDGGAVAKNNSGKTVDEAELNLKLAKTLKEKLESLGATVIMNRTDDSPVTVEERIAFLHEQAPDLCIAIHQNSLSGYPNHSGAEICYFTPFSQPAAKCLYQRTAGSGIYAKTTLGSNFYYVARETPCPVVLMENGYMSNAGDLAGMQDETVLQRKAEAMARGVADYFLSIR